jgi:hypothetical protein
MHETTAATKKSATPMSERRMPMKSEGAKEIIRATQTRIVVQNQGTDK